LCFDLIKLIPYLSYTKHNGDDSAKGCNFEFRKKKWCSEGHTVRLGVNEILSVMHFFI